MLTSEEFTRAVFGEESPWKITYFYDYGPTNSTYSVGLHPAATRAATYNLFTLLPPPPLAEDPEGKAPYEATVVALVQEFVARLTSPQELLKLAGGETITTPARRASTLPLWEDFRPEAYSPLERFLLESLPVNDHPNLAHLEEGIYSPSNALTLLPARFSLNHFALLWGAPTLYFFLEEPSLNKVEERAGVPLPAAFFERVPHYALGTEATRQGLLEVAAFLQTAPPGSYLQAKTQEDWFYLFNLLLESTPWHPAQRPGESYASLMAQGPALTEEFEVLLSTNRGAEDLYRSFRWLQTSFPALTAHRRGREEVEGLVVEWASPTLPATVRAAYGALELPKECTAGLLLLLQALLPHRGEFTEEERARLLEKLSVDSNIFLNEGAPYALLTPQRPRLLSHLLEAWGPVPVARLLLIWPEEEPTLAAWWEADLLASHPEWAFLPLTWWLPLLREAREGKALQDR